MYVITEVGPSASCPDPLGHVAMKLGVWLRATPKSDLHQSDVYFDFFMRALDFEAFPHLTRHPQATAAGTGRAGGAWDWIQEQGRNGVSGPEWWRYELIDKISTIPRKLLRRIGNH